MPSLVSAPKPNGSKLASPSLATRYDVVGKLDANRLPTKPFVPFASSVPRMIGAWAFAALPATMPATTAALATRANFTMGYLPLLRAVPPRAAPALR